MAYLIIGIVIGAVVGTILANVWRNTPTTQPKPTIFLTRKSDGETYRLEQSVPNVAGLGARTVILYRVSNYSLEAWPEDRVNAEFDSQAEPADPKIDRMIAEARARAAAKGAAQ